MNNSLFDPTLPDPLMGDPTSLFGVSAIPTTPQAMSPITGQPPSLASLSPMPPAPVSKPNILERLSQRIKNAIQGNAPAGYDQLLTPDQIEAARPNLFQTIFGEGGSDEFQNNLAGAVNASYTLPQNIAMQKLAMMQKAHQMQVQQDIAKQFPFDPQAQTADQRKRLLDVFTYATENGADPAFIQRLGDVIKEVAKPGALEWHDVGGKTIVTAPGSTTPLAVLDHEPSDFDKQKFNMDFQANQDQHAIANEMRLHDQARTQASQFAATNKSLTDTVPKYTSFLNSIAQAKAGNPAALQTTLYGFVNNTDMNAQMRQGILQQLEKVAPGISNEAQFEFEKNIAGKLSPTVIKNLEATVQPMHDRVMKLYTQRWNALVKSNPAVLDVRGDLAPDMMFNVPEPGLPSPTGATENKVSQYLHP